MMLIPFVDKLISNMKEINKLTGQLSFCCAGLSMNRGYFPEGINVCSK